MEFLSKYGEVKIFAKTIEQEAISQIYKMANSPLGENAHIRIMPDCHAGTGCVIGTTMLITDKVCPNLVGVDIGCGVDLVRTTIDFSERLDELDEVIRKFVPYGQSSHSTVRHWDFEQLRCWDKLDVKVRERAKTALGTLGGGNHFIEAYEGGWLAVHSGSRNIGLKVAQYYQKLAEQRIKEYNAAARMEILEALAPCDREAYLKNHVIKVEKELSYLMGEDLEDYLHDVDVMQKFANDNRYEMLRTIVVAMGGHINYHINSIHNYIDVSNRILRKGAIAAEKGQKLVIPLNMRDGLLFCEGLGNPDWNYSAPHGAGRLYSRSKAKEIFTVEEYAKQMEGIYSSCINKDTLDEAPFAYKDFEEIMECIQPTVKILDRFIPIFNFKASE